MKNDASFARFLTNLNYIYSFAQLCSQPGNEQCGQSLTKEELYFTILNQSFLQYNNFWYSTIVFPQYHSFFSLFHSFFHNKSEFYSHSCLKTEIDLVQNQFILTVNQRFVVFSFDIVSVSIVNQISIVFGIVPWFFPQ